MGTETQYLFGHIISQDIYACMFFFFGRKALDMYNSQLLIQNKGLEWTIRKFYNRNGFRYIASLFFAVGLLIALPETVVWSIDFFKLKDVYFSWNAGFSAAIGYAPIEIFLWLKRKAKHKANEKL